MVRAVCASCGRRYDYEDGDVDTRCPACGASPGSRHPEMKPASVAAPPMGRRVRVMGGELLRLSPLAVASLAFAVVGLLVPYLGALAWILGRAAIKRIDNPIHRERGHDLAAAGVSIGKIGVWMWLVLSALLAVAVPTLQMVRDKARQMQDATQLRGLHQGHILFSKSNNGYYAGLSPYGGQVPDIAPGSHFYASGKNFVSVGLAQLFNQNYFDNAYVISPNEPNPSIQRAYTKTHFKTGSPVTPNNYSFASLQISQSPSDTTRRFEWRDNQNPQAVILADRVLDNGQEASGPVPITNQSSIWSGWWTPAWRGNVVFGDNSVQFLTSSSIPLTHYGRSANTNDNLFVLDDGTLPGADASLVRN